MAIIVILFSLGILVFMSYLANRNEITSNGRTLLGQQKTECLATIPLQKKKYYMAPYENLTPEKSDQMDLLKDMIEQGALTNNEYNSKVLELMSTDWTAIEFEQQRQTAIQNCELLYPD